MKPLAILALLLLALVGVFLFLANSDTVQAGLPAASPRAADLARGDRGQLLTPTRDLALVARTPRDLEELLTFAAAKDMHGIAQTVAAGRAFFAEPGTRVLLIDREGQTARVRMLSGPNEGEDGWTAREWVQPAAP